MCIISFIIGYILALRSIMYGLKFKQQLDKNKEVKLDNPIEKIIKEHKEAKVEQENKGLMEEWFNGGGDAK